MKYLEGYVDDLKKLTDYPKVREGFFDDLIMFLADLSPDRFQTRDGRRRARAFAESCLEDLARALNYTFDLASTFGFSPADLFAGDFLIPLIYFIFRQEMWMWCSDVTDGKLEEEMRKYVEACVRGNAHIRRWHPDDVFECLEILRERLFLQEVLDGIPSFPGRELLKVIGVKEIDGGDRNERE